MACRHLFAELAASIAFAATIVIFVDTPHSGAQQPAPNAQRDDQFIADDAPQPQVEGHLQLIFSPWAKFCSLVARAMPIRSASSGKMAGAYLT
jgi:hypothetical protein